MQLGLMEDLLKLTPSKVYAIYCDKVKEHRTAERADDFQKRERLAKELKVMHRILR